MHGLRFEYERDDKDVVVTAKAEDDHGETWTMRGRVIDVPLGVTVNNPLIVKIRDLLTKGMKETLPR